MIKTRRARLLGLASPVLVAMLAAVCTPGTSATPAPGASPAVLGSTVARSFPTPDVQACTLVSVPELQAATAADVTAPVQSPDGTGCAWTAGTSPITLAVGSAADFDPPAAAEPVDGVGSAAAVLVTADRATVYAADGERSLVLSLPADERSGSVLPVLARAIVNRL